jgi:GntR family phosphonate transport system transcriptional regulator
MEPVYGDDTSPAVWKRIEEALFRDIAALGNKPGERLESEGALARRFGVNRHTIRRAIGGLVQRGLVRVERGRGSFLVGAAVEYALGPRTRFSENLLRQGRAPHHDILAIGESFASKPIAKALNLRVGRPIVTWKSVGRADNSPTSYALHYFAAERLPGIADALRRLRSITQALGELGHPDYRRKWTRITARLAEEDEVQLLALTPARPVLVTEGLNVATDGTALDYGITSFAADRVQLTVDMP